MHEFHFLVLPGYYFNKVFRAHLESLAKAIIYAAKKPPMDFQLRYLLCLKTGCGPLFKKEDKSKTGNVICSPAPSST